MRIAYFSTGIPIASPVVGAGTSYFNQRPDLTCNPASGAPHTTATWFNYSCFAIPASPFVAGNAPAYLDHVRTMGAQDFDMSLYKHFSLGKEKRPALRDFFLQHRQQGAAWDAGDSEHHRGAVGPVTGRTLRPDYVDRQCSAAISVRIAIHVLIKSFSKKQGSRWCVASPFSFRRPASLTVRNAGGGIDGRRASARVIFFTRMAKALAPGRQLCGFLVSDSLQPAPLFRPVRAGERVRLQHLFQRC